MRTVIACLLVLSATAGEAKPAAAGPRYLGPDWAGPERDFRLVDGQVVGPWWQGGGLGVVYFTGPDAQKLGAFESLGQTLAKAMGRPYLEIHKEDLPPNVAAGKGAIAYPDGTARARLFIMPGGNGTKTCADIIGQPPGNTDPKVWAEGRKVPQQAFATGMNYIGTCGGCFTACSGYDIARSVYHHWGLWPGKVTGIGPGQHPPFPDVVLDPALAKHPLWQATDKGVLKSMFFNGGPLNLQSGVPDTEYIGTYVGGDMPQIVGSWFCIAYRPAGHTQSGRVVITTGHPESKHKEFLAAMAAYALDHEYLVPRRALTPGTPATGICGEDQVQYWTIAAPEAGKKLTVTLTGLDDNCDLLVRRGLPPSLRKSDAKSAKPKNADEKATLPSTRAEEYWVGVIGRHQRAAGANYTLTATVE